MKISFAPGAILSLLLFLTQPLLAAEPPQLITFSPPPRTGGKSVMEALHERKTIREIKPEKLSNEILGNLLWAAFGVNRPEIGHRTAPSAMNSQEIDIYVATAEGVYVYEPKPHDMKLVANMDVRGKTSGQAFGTNAPVTLIYVADLSRLNKARQETRIIYANFDAGCICQNVYLFCASEGLGCVVHDLDRGPLRELLKLKGDQQIIMTHAVGWPQR